MAGSTMGSTGSIGSGGTTIMSTMPSINVNERPTSTIITSTNDIHTNVPTSQSTATSDMGTSSIMQTGGTRPPYAERPNTSTMQDRYTPSTGGTISTTNENTNTADGSRYPTTERYPNTGGTGGGSTTNTDHGSTMPYGNTNTQSGTSTWNNMNTYGHTDTSTNEISSRPTYSPNYDNRQTPGYHYPYPPQYDHKHHYYQDVYPTYPYPMPYEPSYGPGYAPNVPSSSYGPPHDYYSNTQHSGSSGNTSPMDRPREPSPAYGVPTSQTRPGPMSSTGSTYMGNGYSNADEIKNSRKPTMSPQNGYLPSKYPEGKYNTSTASTPSMIPYIRTYFNPDDYFPNSKRE